MKKLTRISTLSVVGILVALLIWGGYQQGWTGFADKTLWDWMNLLIVPVVLAGGALWFNQQRAQVEHAIALDNLREETFQKYLDKMTELLLDKNLHRSATPPSRAENRAANSIALARTLSVLRNLDDRRNREVIRFLSNTGLLKGDLDFSGNDKDLSGADLRGVNLKDVDLSDANLSGADLRGADLSGANLCGANLNGADLRRAIFWRDTKIDGADLRNINIHGARGVFPETFAEAYLMRGATWHNGKPYDGRYNMELDIKEAETGLHFIWPNLLRGEQGIKPKPVDIKNPKAMAAFYGVSVKEYERGQADWAHRKPPTKTRKRTIDLDVYEF